MTRKLLFILYILSFVVTSNAQNGYYFQSQFSPVEDTRDQFTYDIEQDLSGNLYFANRIGLMHFNGQDWSLISTPGPIFCFAKQDSTIYAAGIRGFGKIIQDAFGNLNYQSLSDTVAEATDLTKLIVSDSSLVMANGSQLLEYFPKTNRWEVTPLSSTVIALLRVSGQVVIQGEGGFFSSSGQPSKQKILTKNSEWIFCEASPYEGQQLVGNAKNELFLVSKGSITPLIIEDEGYLSESRIVNAQWINSNLVSIGTLKGGVVFVELKTKKILEIANYHTGLPDNEVQSLFRDQDGAVWVAHPHGYTRIAPELPFKSYDYYPGLEGTIYTTGTLGADVYVGTNLGVYYLNRVKNYDEVTYFVKKNPNALDIEPLNFISSLFSKKNTPTTTNSKATPSDSEKKRGGLFGLGRKKEPNQPTTEPTAKTTTRPTKYKKEVRTELKSITYLYKKVPGISGRISQLLELDKSTLIASGLDGLYLIENRQSKELLSEAIKFSFYSKKKNQIICFTYAGNLISLTNRSGKWERAVLLEDAADLIEYIFEDKNGRLWLCTTRTLYWIKTDGKKILESGDIPIPNDFLDPVVGVEDDSLGLIFIHARGFYSYLGDSLVKTNLYGMERPGKYFGSKSRIMVRDSRRWYPLGKTLTKTATLSYLNVYDNIVSVDFRPNGSIWLITAKNDFYRIENTEKYAEEHDPFLSQIRASNNALLPIGNSLTVNQEESSLSFHFNLPEYSGIFNTDYRYRLVGLNDTWSEWSTTNNTVEFAYLPPGKYELEVETRNLFGTERKIEPIHFKVVPPYWKRAWFYGLEFLFFGSLLFFSARLNKAKKIKSQLLNRTLAFLTIIMVIEFIQTAVQARFETSASPVIDFFVQVAIACSLLPLESFMRNRFFEEENQELEGLVTEVAKITKSIRSKGNKNSLED